MKAKQENTPATFVHHTQYAAARMAAFVFRCLPLNAAVLLGKMIGIGFYRFDARHRIRVIDQLCMAYAADLDWQAANNIARCMYLHFGTMLAEFVRIPTLAAGNLDRVINWHGGDRIVRALLDEGKGVIYATGHIGNWELGGYAFNIMQLSAGAVARPLDNPLLDGYVRRIRQSRGQEIWDKFGALRKVVRLLRQGEGVGMLVDQDAGQRGVLAPFFGMPASTMPTPADLAMRTGAPILVCGIQRGTRPMEFDFRVCEPIRARPGEPPEQERLRLLTRMNRDLESIIRQSPAQWLWLHRRWKTQRIYK